MTQFKIKNNVILDIPFNSFNSQQTTQENVMLQKLQIIIIPSF